MFNDIVIGCEVKRPTFQEPWYVYQWAVSTDTLSFLSTYPLDNVVYDGPHEALINIAYKSFGNILVKGVVFETVESRDYCLKALYHVQSQTLNRHSSARRSSQPFNAIALPRSHSSPFITDKPESAIKESWTKVFGRK